MQSSLQCLNLYSVCEQAKLRTKHLVHIRCFMNYELSSSMLPFHDKSQTQKLKWEMVNSKAIKHIKQLEYLLNPFFDFFNCSQQTPSRVLQWLLSWLMLLFVFVLLISNPIHDPNLPNTFDEPFFF